LAAAKVLCPIRLKLWYSLPMPAFLEDKLKAEYGNNPHAIYGTLNKIGAMRGNKETAKGRAMEAKHRRDTRTGKSKTMGQMMQESD
jgi:hypothetical protein